MIAQTLIFAVLLLIMWTIVILLVWRDGREKKKGTAMKDNDLISRSALLERLKPPQEDDERSVVLMSDVRRIIHDFVMSAPAVDAVEVVRCENCIHSNDAGCAMGFTWCDKYDYGVTDDFYCKTGERRAEDATD